MSACDDLESHGAMLTATAYTILLQWRRLLREAKAAPRVGVAGRSGVWTTSGYGLREYTTPTFPTFIF